MSVIVLSFSLFFFLAVSGLSSGMWDLSRVMQDLLMWHMDSLVAPLNLQ